MIRHLPVVIAPPIGEGERPEGADADHPMRKVTRQVAFEPNSWTPERAEKVAGLFDTLAPEWHTRMNAARLEPLRDALERGEPGAGRCVEIGSGTGFGTTVLARHFGAVVAIDLAREMLRLAPAQDGARVQADAARLPIADGVASSVALVNALLFPTEVARVLAPDGTVLWVNSLGDRTPIHLSAEDVVAALPGAWEGVASSAGWGTWCVARRVE